LIIVEGIQNVAGVSYWWGGNLSAAADHPVVLDVQSQLVYSAHDYPATVFNQSWFSASDYPANLPAVWDSFWGSLVKRNAAPVVLGEFGTKNETASDQAWFRTIASYISQTELSFFYWSWNPDSGDTGGILEDDWQTVREDKQAVLQPLLAPLLR
jgi:aryl-phospho-beta-D-glucosidase BglC (GH1 family)